MVRLVALMVFAVGISVASGAEAGAISKACLRADRSAATPTLCNCIQKVANVSLSRSERKKASKFFSDPHKAQVVRQSDRRSDEIFWDRYRAFGEQAKKTCG